MSIMIMMVSGGEPMETRYACISWLGRYFAHMQPFVSCIIHICFIGGDRVKKLHPLG